ncbi:MAG: LytTR family DNA-binding domain-containing protein, partial [Bacteroidota bacterium]
AFEYDVIDYLLKPFSFERFLKAVNKVMVNTNPQGVGSQIDPQIFIKSDKRLHQVYLKDILFIEAFGNYCKVVLEEETIVTLQKISDWKDKLPDNFIRIHKSFIIAKEKIRSINGNRIHIKDHLLPIGQTYKSVVRNIYT